MNNFGPEGMRLESVVFVFRSTGSLKRKKNRTYKYQITYQFRNMPLVQDMGTWRKTKLLKSVGRKQKKKDIDAQT